MFGTEKDDDTDLSALGSKKSSANEPIEMGASSSTLPEPIATEHEISVQQGTFPEDEGEDFIPEQLMAQRKADDGVEFLVRWEVYPNEKDWTWEPESAMLCRRT